MLKLDNLHILKAEISKKGKIASRIAYSQTIFVYFTSCCKKKIYLHFIIIYCSKNDAEFSIQGTHT